MILLMMKIVLKCAYHYSQSTAGQDRAYSKQEGVCPPGMLCYYLAVSLWKSTKITFSCFGHMSQFRILLCMSKEAALCERLSPLFL